MKCQLCDRRIGLLRRLWDREYCCAEHRRRRLATSARALRDIEVYEGGFEEAWLDYIQPSEGKKQQQKSASSGSIITAVGIATLALVAVSIVNQNTPPTSDQRNASRSDTFSDWVGKQLARLPRAEPRLHLEANFVDELKKWEGLGGGNKGWSLDRGLMRPSDLRIWRDSLKLADYRFSFEGQIEQKGMSWAFRAYDHRNYYASKIQLPKAGESSNGEIVRFAMFQGQESKRIRLPLPLAVQKNTFYNVEVKVKGDRFITSIGGQVVDVWRDSRLRRGGVGFFVEQGEVASVRSVSIDEPDRFLDKLRSYLYLSLIAPGSF